MYNLDDIESQITDDQTRQALLSVLKARLAKLQQTETEPALTKITKENCADSGDSGDCALQPQQLPTDSQVSASRSDPDPTDSAASDTSSDNAKNFAAALDKLDPALRQTAADLYEHLHYKSKFARLTSVQREAIVELLRHHTCERVAAIIAQPPPIGMNFQTSPAGVVRFRHDYMRCASQDRQRESQQAEDQRRLAMEESFKTANASPDTFRQTTERHIRKRLFDVVNNPNSDYHEIRWLIKSLEMLSNQ